MSVALGVILFVFLLSSVRIRFRCGNDGARFRQDEIVTLEQQVAEKNQIIGERDKSLSALRETIGKEREQLQAAHAERDAYASAMAIALREGIFLNKSDVTKKIKAVLSPHEYKPGADIANGG
ncbi:MAG: hypothetical protein J7501_03930 [Bdellovibrio sp.]|nr:hypothetical protein [Bdellovibrio sp.]